MKGNQAGQADGADRWLVGSGTMVCYRRPVTSRFDAQIIFAWETMYSLASRYISLPKPWPRLRIEVRDVGL